LGPSSPAAQSIQLGDALFLGNWRLVASRGGEREIPQSQGAARWLDISPPGEAFPLMPMDDDLHAPGLAGAGGWGRGRAEGKRPLPGELTKPARIAGGAPGPCRGLTAVKRRTRSWTWIRMSRPRPPDIDRPIACRHRAVRKNQQASGGRGEGLRARARHCRVFWTPPPPHAADHGELALTGHHGLHDGCAIPRGSRAGTLACVKFKKLVGGGVFKALSTLTVRPRLIKLGYTGLPPEQGLHKSSSTLIRRGKTIEGLRA